MENCNHKKVFANFSYATNPPKTPWVCSECGEKGIDRGFEEKVSYEDILKKFNLK